jgi:hypothetical protein
MRKTRQTNAKQGDWKVVRDFEDDGSGFRRSRYEVKLVTDVEKEFVESDLVMVKETDSFAGHTRVYHLPKEVVENAAATLFE